MRERSHCWATAGWELWRTFRRACDRHGVEQDRVVLSFSCQYLLTRESLPPLLELMARTDDDDVLFMEGRSASDVIREAIEQYVERKRST